MPSYGQEVNTGSERPGRPIADSDSDFVIPLTKIAYLGACVGETEHNING